MTQLKQPPDLEKVKRTVERLRVSNRQLEAVTLALDELIKRVEADIRHNPLTTYRLGKHKISASEESAKESGAGKFASS